MKPLVKYRGGKSKEISQLVKHIPQYGGRYIEPFFGGGALFFHIEPSNAIINDINKKLISFYCGVRDDFSRIKKELIEIEHLYTKNRRKFEKLKTATPDERVQDDNESLYYEFRDMFNEITEKTYSDATVYFFINKTAYSGMIRYNTRGEFNVPYGRYANLNTSLITPAHHLLLNRTQIYNLDYSEIFSMATAEDFIFLDPPYDCTFSDYGNSQYKEGFTEEDHRRLAQHYKNLPCKALMVIGKTPLTERLYSDLIIDEYGKSYTVNIRNRFKSQATHIIIANYPCTAATEQSELIFDEVMYHG